MQKKFKKVWITYGYNQAVRLHGPGEHHDPCGSVALSLSPIALSIPTNRNIVMPPADVYGIVNVHCE
jgi:hypothetical protein